MFGVALGLQGTLVTIVSGIEAAARQDVRNALSADEEEVDRALEAAEQDHRQKTLAATYRQTLTRLAPSFTTPLPGAAELVEKLHSLRMPLAVLANGYSGATRE